MGRREGAVRCVLEVLVRASVGSNRARFPAVSVLSAVKEAAERAGFELDPYSLNQFNGLIDTPSRPWYQGVVPIFTARGGKKSVRRPDRDSNMPRAIPVIARAQLPGARQCRTASSEQFLGHADYFQETSNRPDVGHQG